MEKVKDREVELRICKLCGESFTCYAGTDTVLCQPCFYEEWKKEQRKKLSDTDA